MNVLNNGLVKKDASNDLMVLDNTAIRTVEEVKGSILVAKHCLRDEEMALEKILSACRRKKLAETAMYAYPRGGQVVTGPSIRLAETISRHWGNIQSGIRELEKTENKTTYEAYAWDVQNNVRSSRIFSQVHARYTKKGGLVKVDDPRDVYEIVASQATRRLRACILEIIPGDIIEEAIQVCEQTLKNQNDPIKDRVGKMLGYFSEYGVSKEMIEKRIQKGIEAVNEVDILNLGKIYQSLKDRMSKVEDWFEEEKSVTKNLNEGLKE